MVRIQKLLRPNKHSGHNIPVGKTHKIRGLVISNVSAGPHVFVDPFTRKKAKVVKKKKK